MRARRDAAAAAFQFLSRFPVRSQPGFSPELLRRSVVYYPLVGAAIGLSVAAGGAAASWLLPAGPAAVITLCLWVGLTGGLHLDGWMDSADGLLSYRPRERMLEIMKDSRVGAMGVLACVLLLLLKASLLSAWLARGQIAELPLLLLPPVWSRWFMVRTMVRLPIARGDEGLAASFAGLAPAHERRALAWAALLSLAAAAAPLALGAGLAAWPQHLAAAVLLPVAALACGTAAARRASSRLGGLTGDVYGALNELLEAVLLLALVLLQHNLL
ncbi:adenosylcobinamide-GDP ribazoletransferase [Paenibacillus donghaensis]|uniref:Adenosylcobinamide-GDP ribazoletransferase n=1 Tax=Paenibacillus donghaensis TaxID=414771 RepID=A0A2Z2KIG9_9BACL|nr:adenosylcobinamide-GDP ribazoletransferase [Paenibacillus donghaensis]ASA19611.1 adenosylcobinamide-GDP ribazoletransferase [Paenibacillus donghaensis]